MSTSTVVTQEQMVRPFIMQIVGEAADHGTRHLDMEPADHYAMEKWMCLPRYPIGIRGRYLR
jgi:hypothetical protein